MTYILPGLTPLNIPPDALPGMKITYQSVNFTQIFGALRKKMLSPNEIHGIVTSTGSVFQVAVEWPRAPSPKGGGEALTRFLTPPFESLQEAADYIACSMSWANAASQNAEAAAWPRAQFCDWSGALGDFVALSAKTNSGTGLSDEEAARVRRRVAQLRSLDLAWRGHISRLLSMTPGAARRRQY